MGKEKQTNQKSLLDLKSRGLKDILCSTQQAPCLLQLLWKCYRQTQKRAALH